MILIQVILIAGFLWLLIKLLGGPHGSRVNAWKKIIGLGFIVIAISAVLFPEISNKIAHWVGVGRGADLLLYILTLAFIFVCINLYLSDSSRQKKFNKVVRRLAILEANQRQNSHREK